MLSGGSVDVTHDLISCVSQRDCAVVGSVVGVPGYGATGDVSGTLHVAEQLCLPPVRARHLLAVYQRRR